MIVLLWALTLFNAVAGLGGIGLVARLTKREERVRPSNGFPLVTVNVARSPPSRLASTTAAAPLKVLCVDG